MSPLDVVALVLVVFWIGLAVYLSIVSGRVRRYGFAWTPWMERRARHKRPR